MQVSKIAGNITFKITCKKDTFNLPRVRYLELTCKLKQQYYIKYVDFDVEKTFKNSNWSLVNIPQWKIRWIQTQSEQKTGKFQRKSLYPISILSVTWFWRAPLDFSFLFAWLKWTFQIIWGGNRMCSTKQNFVQAQTYFFGSFKQNKCVR